MMRHSLVTALLALSVSCKGGDRAPLPAPNAAPDAPAPNQYRVRLETSRGPFVVEVRRDWAPRGADRFHHLVQSGFYDNTRFFRVVTGFVVQWGAHGDPAVSAAWEKLPIQDDSVRESNKRGTIVFATAGPNTRTTQLFVNLVDNTQLDGMGFAPFGTVVEGMAVVDSINAEYGEQPDQAEIAARGNAYLEKFFPKLDFIRVARVEGTPTATADSTKK